MNHDTIRSQWRKNARTAANRPCQPAAIRSPKVACPTRSGVGLERLELRTVTISRGMGVKLNVGLPPKPATGDPRPTAPKPAGQQPYSPPPTFSPTAAVFAGIGAGMPDNATISPGARKR